jgi:hypothetical protein
MMRVSSLIENITRGFHVRGVENVGIISGDIFCKQIYPYYDAGVQPLTFGIGIQSVQIRAPIFLI